MRIGDLVKNIATGDLAIVTGVGGADEKMWLTLSPIRGSKLGKDIVYHAEYFEVISHATGRENNGNWRE
jgi:hypothetical protein|tara:strand:- start:948 stop:1154 length:207 start_codon:yes stop_codon:yes gene_type:complete